MSTTIDQRVVEMRFDNSNFEKNTRESMSTLDKLKQKLNLTGASKGLENLSSSAKKVDMSGLANSVNTVTSRFSALEVMGVTALVNITNSAINAGKRMISALTIDPVKTGFQEYETQLNSVQTIMANVGHKGKTLEDVNKALDELNEYADQTIYNFTEMTRNIGLFTNAGIDLDTSVAAIKGFSNAAAMAGTDATSTARAMYQLSQAFSSGSVKLLDWRSLETANITGERFQETVKETAKVHGINVDAMIEKEGSFRETLKSGWLTAELMAETLNHYTLSRESMTEAEQKAAKAQMRSIGYTEEQIEKLFDLGTEASNAATKVKTFTQLWGVLQESAQSGWAKTWQIIIGDFEEAKAFFTPLANFLTGVIDKISDARNKFLSAALGNPLTALFDKLNMSGALKNIKGVSKGLEYYQEMTTSVWRGDWKNQPYRKGLLEDEGHNFSVIQTLVNKGYLYKLTLEDVAEAEAKYGITAEKTTEILEELSDAKLREAGLTESEIKLYRRLEEQSKKTGKPIKELLETMETKDGRTLLIESLSNAGNGLVGIFKALGEAWDEVFPKLDPVDAYLTLDSLNKFSEKLKLTDESGELNENGKKIKRIFKGLAAILDIVATLIMGPLGVALKLVGQLFKALDIPVLDFLANFADAIVVVHDMAKQIFDFGIVFEVLAPMVNGGIELMKEWTKSAPNSEWFKNFKNGMTEVKQSIADFITKMKKLTAEDYINFFKNLGESIKKFFTGLNDKFGGIPGDLILGLVNGIKEGAKNAINGIINLAKMLIDKFKEVLGIHSPSTVFFMIGSFIVAGLIGGLLAGEGDLMTSLGGIGSRIGEFFANIDWGKLFAGGMSVGLLMLAKQIIDIVRNLSGPMAGVGDLLSGVGTFLEKTAKGTNKILIQTSKVVGAFKNVVKQIGKSIKDMGKAWAFKQKTEGIKNLAISLLMIAGALALLSVLNVGKLWNAVGVLTVIAIVLAGLYWALNKISGQAALIENGKLKISGIQTTLISLGIAMLAITAAVKMIGKMDTEQAIQGFLGLLGVTGALLLLMWGVKELVTFSNPEDMTAAAKMLKKMATAMLLMVLVIKLCRFLDIEDAIKGGLFMGAFVLFVKGLSSVTQKAGPYVNDLGKMLLKMSIALLLLIAVMKLVNMLEPGEFWNGVVFLGLFVVFVKYLVKSTKIGGSQQIAKIGGMLLGISASLLLLIGVMKLVNMLNFWEVLNGVIFLGGFILFVKALVNVTKIGGKQQIAKVAGTIFAMAAAIGILAGVCMLLSLLDPGAMWNGILAVGALGVLMIGMIKATKGAKDVWKSLIVMAAAIAIMAVAIAALSFIPDHGKLWSAVGAIGVLMAVFAGLEYCSKFVKKSSIGTLAVMVGAITVMAIALGLLAQLPWQQTLGAAAGLSLLMLALSAAMLIISKAKASVAGALIGVVGLLALCVPLLAIAGILMLMNNTQNAIANATALSLLLGVMTGVLVVLSLIGTALGAGALIGVVGLLALCVPLVAIVGILILMNNVNDAMGTVLALSTLLITMTAVLTILAFIGPLAYMGVGAIGALTLVLTAIGALVIAIGALMENFPQLQSFLDTGIAALVRLAGGLGEMIGAFVNGVFTTISAGLPVIGSNLSLFMENLSGFISGVKSLGQDDTAIKGVGTLVAAILGLTVAGFLSGLAALYSFGLGSLVALGLQLTLFAEGAKGFFDTVKGIDPASMEAVKSLADAISVLTTANFIEGLTKLFGGSSSLETFGGQLGTLGENLATFVTKLGVFSTDQVNSVKCAADAIVALSNAAKNLPGQGGLWQGLVGEQSLAVFGSGLGDLGKNIAAFVNNLGTFGEDKKLTVETAGQAIVSLANAAKELPNEGGLWQKMFGEQSLATFGGHLPGLGTNLAAFVSNLGTFTDAQKGTVECAGGAISALASAAKDLPNEGGFWQKLFGEQSLATFGGHLPGLATNLKDFVKNLGEFNKGQIATVTSACNAITAIADLGKIDVKDTGSKLKDFGGKMVEFAKKLKEFATKAGEAGADAITAGITKAKLLVEMAKTVASTNVNSLKTFGESLKQFAKDGIKGFADELGKKTPRDDAKKAIKDLIDEVIDGANDKKSDMKNKFEDLAEQAVKGLDSSSSKNKAESAGKAFAQGFANGIKNNQYLATNAASNLGKAALSAAKKAINSNSPSKESMKVGNYFGEGFVIGIKEYASRVYGASYEIADRANSGLSKAIAKVSDLISNGVDAQPTIRPILDLSDVESGAGYLNTMFNNGPSIGVAANLKSISSGVNARLQNGVNDDVISAIEKLRKDLGNVGGDTYNFGDVRYDDESSISNAVRELVRAVKVEGRR